MSSDIQVALLRKEEAHALSNVAPGVFDNEVDLKIAVEFLSDPRHHLAVVQDQGSIVGMASAVHYVHPDKQQPELWINEIAVAPSHRRKGFARQLLTALLDHARDLGCSGAWVLTERSNAAAVALYEATGARPPHTDDVMFEYQFEGSNTRAE